MPKRRLRRSFCSPRPCAARRTGLRRGRDRQAVGALRLQPCVCAARHNLDGLSGARAATAVFHLNFVGDRRRGAATGADGHLPVDGPGRQGSRRTAAAAGEVDELLARIGDPLRRLRPDSGWLLHQVARSARTVGEPCGARAAAARRHRRSLLHQRHRLAHRRRRHRRPLSPPHGFGGRVRFHRRRQCEQDCGDFTCRRPRRS